MAGQAGSMGPCQAQAGGASSSGSGPAQLAAIGGSSAEVCDVSVSFVCRRKKPSAVVAAEFLPLLCLVLPFITKVGSRLPSTKFERSNCHLTRRIVPRFDILSSGNGTVQYIFLEVLVKH